MARVKLSGIYVITNLVTKKVYVGSSIDMEGRWKSHIRLLRKGTHNNTKLQRSWNLHGEGNFRFHILESCPQESLEDREDFHISKLDSYNNGYNATPQAGGKFMRGQKWREETRESRVSKMREFTHSEESIRLISDIKKSQWEDPEIRAKYCKPHKSMSEEGKKNIGEATSKRYQDPEAKKAHSERMKLWWAERKGKAAQA